jgi:hypothetical protein
MSKIHQTKDELERQLSDQLELLKELAGLYDSGKTVAAKAISTTVRVLVHDTTNSTSLLTQLGRKNVDFFDSVGLEAETWGKGQRVGSYNGLVGAGTNSKYFPYLDDTIPESSKYVPFDEYWERVILIDGKGNSFTRKDIILTLTNQDGGTHVDPGLSAKYAELSRQNSMGLTAWMNDEQPKVFEGVELAVVRQIGHEILRTLDREYPKQRMKTEGAIGIMGGLTMFKKGAIPEAFTKKAILSTGRKVGRNEPCPCGSGKKYKRCHL